MLQTAPSPPQVFIGGHTQRKHTQSTHKMVLQILLLSARGLSPRGGAISSMMTRISKFCFTGLKAFIKVVHNPLLACTESHRKSRNEVFLYMKIVQGFSGFHFRRGACLRLFPPLSLFSSLIRLISPLSSLFSFSFFRSRSARQSLT